MKQIPLQIHCVFPEAGEALQELVERSFFMFLRRVLAEDGASGEQ